MTDWSGIKGKKGDRGYNQGKDCYWSRVKGKNLEGGKIRAETDNGMELRAKTETGVRSGQRGKLKWDHEQSLSLD